MAAKKSPAKKTAKKPAKRKVTAVQKPMTKAAMVNEIAENTGLTKKNVSGVLEELGILIERHVKKRSAGQFTLPGLLKIEVKQKKATKARKGVNPFTGEEMTIKAKPARRVVKIRPLKGLKEMLG
jgi:nucleoid DNA-binding protein